MLSKEQKKTEVKKILNKVVTNVLYNKPDDITPHILQVLLDIKGTGVQSLTKDERKELTMLREELEVLNRQPQITVEKDNKLKFDSDSDEDEDEDEYLDEMTEAYSPINNHAKVLEMQRNRKSISAEVFCKFNQKDAF
jgi:hypothetical protein